MGSCRRESRCRRGHRTLIPLTGVELAVLLRRCAELLDAEAREAVRQAVAEVRLLAPMETYCTWSALGISSVTDGELRRGAGTHQFYRQQPAAGVSVRSLT
jgi:hypothetical protein